MLILDEATSALDTKTEQKIMNEIYQISQNKTLIIIAHRLSTIKKATQILVIEEGNIAERGTHEELITKEGRYFDLYTYQSRI